MRATEIFFIAGWVAFWVYWFYAARLTRSGRIPWGTVIWTRVVMFVILVFIARTGVFHHPAITHNVVREIVGIVIYIAGLSFAVWARRNIGRNWGMPMTEKKDSELVTSGPYRFVRHPIYTGILFGFIGTAIAISWLWFVVGAFAGAYFIYSALNEERYMTKEFPDTYPPYKRSTKMLVPFLF